VGCRRQSHRGLSAAAVPGLVVGADVLQRLVREANRNTLDEVGAFVRDAPAKTYEATAVLFKVQRRG
jgi:hypothetical protein